MKKVVNVPEPNFYLGEVNTLQVKTDKCILELASGDGLRLVNFDDKPHLEFTVNERQFTAEFGERNFEKLLEHCHHASRVSIKTQSLSESILDPNISNKDLASIINDAEDKEGYESVSFSIMSEADMQDKIEKVRDAEYTVKPRRGNKLKVIGIVV